MNPIVVRNLSPSESNKAFLQVGYRSVSAAELDAFDAPAIEQLRSALREPLSDPRAGLNALKAQVFTLEPGGPPAELTGPAVVLGLILNVGSASFAELKNTRLVVSADGNRCVDVPIPYLVSRFWELGDYTGVFTAVQGPELIFRFPLPCAKQLSFSLQPQATAEQTGRPHLQQGTLTAYVAPLESAPDRLFCAQYSSAISKRGTPLTFADIQGEGTFLGCAMGTDGLEHRTFGFLEGNEQIYVDNADEITLEGTGTEDFFNGAWYFRAGVTVRPFHGLVYYDTEPPPRCSCYRYLIPDRIPFAESLRFDLQHGSRNSVPDTLYQAVVFWYQRPPVSVQEPMEAVPATESSDTALGGEHPPLLGLSLLAVALVILVIVAVVVGFVLFLRRPRRRTG